MGRANDEENGGSMGLTEDEVAARARDIKVFGFDLDGTFLRDDKSVSPRTKAAVRALIEHGIEPVPTTGRTWQRLCQSVLGMDEFHYTVCACGSVIRDRTTGEFLRHDVIDPRTAAELIRRLKQPGVVIYLCLDDPYGTRLGDCISRDEYVRVRGKERWKEPLTCYDVPALIEANRWGVVKVGVRYAAPWHDDDFIAIGDELNLTSNPCGPNNVEYNVPGVSKAGGLATVAERLGCTIDNVCTIGDSGNDVEMLRAAGLGIAMGNATEVAREAADYTLPFTNEQDGLADFIERYLLV